MEILPIPWKVGFFMPKSGNSVLKSKFHDPGILGRLIKPHIYFLQYQYLYYCQALSVIICFFPLCCYRILNPQAHAENSVPSHKQVGCDHPVSQVTKDVNADQLPLKMHYLGSCFLTLAVNFQITQTTNVAPEAKSSFRTIANTFSSLRQSYIQQFPSYKATLFANKLWPHKRGGLWREGEIY